MSNDTNKENYVALRLDSDLHRALQAGARAHDRSMSSYVRCALRDRLYADGQLQHKMPYHLDRD
jgi:predicted transcriptional regulator